HEARLNKSFLVADHQQSDKARNRETEQAGENPNPRQDHRQQVGAASFMDLILDPDLGVAGRPILMAAVGFALTILYYGVASPVRQRAQLAGGDDFRNISQWLLASDQPRPDNILAYTGDKSIFYGPDGRAGLAYANYGGSSIAMGPPIGPRSAWKETLERFRTDMEQAGIRPALYSVPPDLLPDLHDLNFRYEKIGENATLDLATFTLSGRKREVIRRARRKLAERAGAMFEISLPPHKSAILADLRAVSDLWLGANGGREKSFSLGRFDPHYLAHCPIGIVHLGGKTVAFGSLMVTPDKSWVGIDLMRYDPERAITNTMDFLLVELILWAKAEDYRKFDLAMAPLSGMTDQEAAPLFAQVGQFVFENAERFYNFQGLRRFKQKFNPDWEPRYIAAPGYWTLPILLAQVAFLTNRDAPVPETSPSAPQETTA
ncbi:MAG: phosphatidylglycerol lysyltransferase domain-containing protein, partial [Pseudomonadota bacterium]